ncbi:MAG: hypothetical protein H6888_11150 [Nitratireductor sp.]|nr:hypothetical protein [Nitratireductor sp.]MCC0021612.1 hypothetical protein [Nitratireductor sp.]
MTKKLRNIQLAMSAIALLGFAGLMAAVPVSVTADGGMHLSKAWADNGDDSGGESESGGSDDGAGHDSGDDHGGSSDSSSSHDSGSGGGGSDHDSGDNDDSLLNRILKGSTGSR